MSIFSSGIREEIHRESVIGRRIERLHLCEQVNKDTKRDCTKVVLTVRVGARAGRIITKKIKADKKNGECEQ